MQSAEQIREKIVDIKQKLVNGENYSMRDFKCMKAHSKEFEDIVFKFVENETKIQADIISFLQILEDRGELVYQRTNNGAVYDVKQKIYRRPGKGHKKGFPDIIVLKRGILYMLEVKKPKGKQTAEQKWWENQAERHGAYYFVVHSVYETAEALGVKI